MTVAEPARTGDQLKTLEAVRDHLASAIDSCESHRDLAPLAARMLDVLAQIADVKAQAPEQEGTPLDELQRRRATRGAAATS